MLKQTRAVTNDGSREAFSADLLLFRLPNFSGEDERVN